MASDAMALDGSARGRSELVAALRQVAPPGLERVDAGRLARLRAITRELVELTDAPGEQCEQFEAQRLRGLPVQVPLLREQVAGRTIVVTGGTGCIGTALLEELQDLSPARVISVSRGQSTPARTFPFVEYVHADIRDAGAVRLALQRVSPEVVFHLAAQRDPGVAEMTIVDSLMTNVVGTSHVIAASQACDAESFVYASTGKALRPYTPHVYAASKKFGELLTYATALTAGAQRYSVARFTHVVDNSLVLRKFRATGRDDAIALHDPATLFYTQSAREAAQLLLCAHCNARAGAGVDVMAIRDLGLPAELLGLALGVVSEGRSAQALYVKGYEPGYDDSFYPGLYDPETAADVSPLLNAFEAVRARDVADAGIDASPIGIDDPERMRDMVGTLESMCARGSSPALVRGELEAVSMQLFRMTLTGVEAELLQRLVRLTLPWRATMSEINLLIDDGLRERAGIAATLV
jgi:NAD(P)-dependent dehydrogenase (short-subunit alcohol dehydrogenase family)